MEYTFYKIQVGNECYVGSTKNYKNRISNHKHSCHHDTDTNYNFKVYKSIRELGWDNIDVMIIDKIIYNYKNEAFDMETKYMTMFDAKLNMVYPKRTKEEYYEANKKKVSNYHKLYNEKHKEKEITIPKKIMKSIKKNVLRRIK